MNYKVSADGKNESFIKQKDNLIVARQSILFGVHDIGAALECLEPHSLE